MGLIENGPVRAFCAVLVLLWSLGGCGWLQSPKEKAAEYLAEGDFAAARIEAANAIKKNENDAEAYLLLGQALFGQADFLTADRLFKQAANLGIEPQRVEGWRAKALLRARAYDVILAELAPQPFHPGDSSALVLAARGHALLAASRLEEARSAFADALRLVPELPEARLGQAGLALREHRPDAALQIVAEITARYPQYSPAWAFTGGYLRSQGKMEEALQAFDQAVGHDPANLEALLAAAESSLALKRFDVAERYVRTARKAFPNFFLVRHAQALLYYEQGKFDQALSETQAVYKMQPDYLPAILLSGATLYARGDLGQAAEAFRRVLHEEPGNVVARKLAAATALRQGNPKDALAVLQTILSDPASISDKALLTLAAETHVLLGHFAQAGDYYEKVARLEPADANVIARIGITKFASGNAAAGLALLENAAAASRDNVTADTALVLLQLQQGDSKAALAAALRMQAKAPGDPIGFNLAGVAQMRLSDPDAARQSFEAAVRIAPAYWPAAASLARLDLAAGDRASARTRVERVIAKDPNNVESMQALLDLTGDRGRFVNSLENARQANPKAISARVVLAREYLRAGLAERALIIAREAVAAAPGKAEAMEVMGSAQAACARYGEALTTFREMAAAFPASHIAFSRLGSVYAAMGDSRNGEAAYRKALSLKPGDGEASVGLALLYQRDGRLDDALRLAHELQTKLPEAGIGYLLTGDLYFGARRYADAAKAYDVALSRAPSGALLVNRHVARARAGENPDDAPLVQWLQDHPYDLDVRMFLADLRFIAADYREAASQYEAIAQLDPNRAVAWNNLANAYMKLKDLRALAAAEAGQRLLPENAAMLDTLGVAQMRFGKPGLALQTLKKAVARNPDSSETRINYALALARTGDTAAARLELKQLLHGGKTVVLDAEAKALLQEP